MEDSSIEMSNVVTNGEHEMFFAERLTETSSVNLRWNGISVWTKPQKSYCRRSKEAAQILRSISGSVNSGELLAVMGPSGSGKSTLLNALNGRYMSEYIVEGEVLINGQLSGIEHIKKLSGYVQQGDCFVPMLTVREHLVFHSLVRMDKNITQAERLKRIDEVIKELGLTKCQSTRIGNRYDDIVGSGISGGELRRLAFGAEILTNPPLLFCDEPTSGLDSHHAENVVQILKKLARNGKTIICTIHQPSSEVFILFDKLLLLSESRLAFIGSLDDAKEHFNSLGYECPNNFNPADYYLKQLSVLPGYEDESLEKINKICNHFSEKNTDIPSVNNSNKGSTERIHYKASVYKSSWWEQFHALLWRSFISNLREPMITRIKLAQYLTVALLLGIVYWNQKVNQRGIMNINGAIFIIIINLTFMNLFSVINTFCSELPIFLREHNNAMYRVDTYFLSKMISELPFQILMPTIFVALLYYMVNFNNSFYCYLMFIFICNLVSGCGNSFGYMISCMSSSTKMAIALSSPLILPLLIFGGFFLNNGSIPIYFEIFKFISWFYYGNESLTIVQWKSVENIECEYMYNSTDLLGENRCLRSGISVIQMQNFDPNRLLIDIIAMVLMIFILRILAFNFLLIKSSKR